MSAAYFLGFALNVLFTVQASLGEQRCRKKRVFSIARVAIRVPESGTCGKFGLPIENTRVLAVSLFSEARLNSEQNVQVNA